jgi:hypothetical protein
MCTRTDSAESPHLASHLGQLRGSGRVLLCCTDCDPKSSLSRRISSCMNPSLGLVSACAAFIAPSTSFSDVLVVSMIYWHKMVALRLFPSKQCTSTEFVGVSMAAEMNCDAAAKCAERSSCV